MITLNQATGLFDISSLIQVQQYTMLTDAEIQIRADLGDASNPISGDTLYQIRYDIDGRSRDDYVDIASGIMKSVIQSGRLTVFSGEVITVYIAGSSTDTNVRIISDILDVSPSLTTFSGAIGNSVWTEEEKNVVIKALKLLTKDIRKIKKKPDSREDIQEVRALVESIIQSKDLTNLENRINLLYKNFESNETVVKETHEGLKRLLLRKPEGIDEERIKKLIQEAMQAPEKIVFEISGLPEKIEQTVEDIPERI